MAGKGNYTSNGGRTVPRNKGVAPGRKVTTLVPGGTIGQTGSRTKAPQFPGGRGGQGRPAPALPRILFSGQGQYASKTAQQRALAANHTVPNRPAKPSKPARGGRTTPGGGGAKKAVIKAGGTVRKSGKLDLSNIKNLNKRKAVRQTYKIATGRKVNTRGGQGGQTKKKA